MSVKTRAMIAGAAGNVIFGLSYLFSTGALDNLRTVFAEHGIAPGAEVPCLLAIRSVIALAVMTLMLPIMKVKISFRGKPVLKLILFGIFQPVLYFIGETYGLEMTGIVISSILIALVPVCSQFAAVFFLKEKTTPMQIVLGILSVAAVAFVGITSGGDDKKTYIAGILFLLLAVVSATAFNIIGRSIVDSFDAFERTYGMFIVSAVVFTVYALFALRGNVSLLIKPFAIPSFDIQIVYLGILSSVFAYWMTNFARSELSVTRATIFINVITVVSTFSGFFYYGYFDVSQAICCFVIVLCVIFMQRSGTDEMY